MDGSTRPVPRTSTRRTDLDLLRIIVCAGVILGHALLIYAAEPRYHLKAPTEWVPATVLYEAIRITSLPIFFCLAGWSAVGSLRRRDAQRYIKDRLLRVLLPLFAGILLLGPIIKWIELQQGRDLRLGGFRLVPPPEYSFVEFLGRYLTRVDTMTWSHLWFLAYLFVISVALLPALRWLARRPVEQRMPGRLAAYAPALGLAALIAATGAYWPFLPSLVHDWANLFYFATCFGVGAVLAAWPGLEARLRAEAPGLALLALAGFVLVLWAGPSTLGRIGVGLCAWGSIGAGLGFAGRHPPRATPLFNWLGESTMAVYVVHHVPVLLLGLAVLPLGWAPGWGVLAVWIGGTILSLLVYRLLVQPWPVPRLLSGMPARA